LKYVARFDSEKIWTMEVAPVMDEYLQGKIGPDQVMHKLRWSKQNFLYSLGHVFSLLRQGFQGFSITPISEEVYVAVLGGGGLVENVVVCITREGAMEAITKHLEGSGYTADTWFEKLEETHDYPDEDYDPTNLYMTEIE